jgi:hypothetical protein
MAKQGGEASCGLPSHLAVKDLWLDTAAAAGLNSAGLITAEHQADASPLRICGGDRAVMLPQAANFSARVSLTGTLRNLLTLSLAAVTQDLAERVERVKERKDLSYAFDRSGHRSIGLANWTLRKPSPLRREADSLSLVSGGNGDG